MVCDGAFFAKNSIIDVRQASQYTSDRKSKNFLRRPTNDFEIIHGEPLILKDNQLVLLYSYYYLASSLMSPADIYLFKFNNGNTGAVCEICSKLTIKTA